MHDNRLCGVDFMGQGTYTSEGITKLCEGLKGSSVTSLECAAAQSVCLLSTPVDTRLLSLPPPIPCSLGFNGIRVEGASALAAVLKETRITNIKCAAARVFA